MQKAVRLNILARNSAAKSSRKLRDRDTKKAWKEWHQATNRNKAEYGDFMAEERVTRRQDWMAGPLAPNRNSGTARGVYGTVDPSVTQNPEIPKSIRAGPKGEGYAIRSDTKNRGFRGRTIVGNVIAGDRVVIIAGPDRLRGLIGFVKDIDLEREEVTLRNMNTVDVRFPLANQPPPSENDPNPAKYTTVDAPIPMAHVRLVATLTDDDGVTRDAVVRHVRAGPPYVQREMGSNLPSHTRYVTGLSMKADSKELGDGAKEMSLELPWPSQSFPDSFEHFEGDTQRSIVSRPTWNIMSVARTPLGYSTETPYRVEYGDNAYSRAPELSTIDVKGPVGLQNAQRAGLDGFIDDTKLIARRERIAEGIMNELRSKYSVRKPRTDDAEFIKRSMLEDARAIWYQERKLIPPAAQAAELAANHKAIERALKSAEKSQSERAAEIGKLADEVRKLEIQQRGFVASVTTKNKIGKKIQVHSIVGFNPDKKLGRVVTTTAKLESRVNKRQARLIKMAEFEARMRGTKEAKLAQLRNESPEAAKRYAKNLRKKDRTKEEKVRVRQAEMLQRTEGAKTRRIEDVRTKLNLDA